MKSLNAKKIAAVVTGAALLGVGLAAASSVTYSSVPIINNAGQPVVQVVVGSSAKPSDAVAAGNIAAAIGNLAFTSTTKVFPANVTEAQSVLSIGASPGSYTLANQKVTLNVSSSTVLSGAYSFTGLIGSVLNHGLQIGSPQNTKSLDGTGSYSYLRTTTISSTPSPYTAAGAVPWSSVTSSYNGGGISFTSFSSGSYDNILQVTNANLPSLLSNSGGNGETEALWVSGYPVYNQNAKSLALMSAGGAYYVTFNKPINIVSSGNTVNNAAISLFGQDWTIIDYYPAGATKWVSQGQRAAGSSASGTTAINGGKLQIASSLSPWTTVYVNGNMTAGPYRVQLTGLGNTNTNGVSQAAVAIYYNNATAPTNTSVLSTGTTYPFNVSGNKIFIKVNQTFNGGSFTYQQWAKLQVYTNVYNITDGQAFNKTNDPGWTTNLLWTNASGSGTKADALQGIAIYNASPTTLLQGQSLSFIQNPSAWKLQFVGTTLGSGGFDALQTQAKTEGSVTYANAGSQGTAAAQTGPITNITEPAQELVISSGIPNAFSYSGQTGSTLTALVPTYQLNEVANAITATAGATGNFLWISIGTGAANSLITTQDPLTVTVSGATKQGGALTTLGSATFPNTGSGNSWSANTGVSSVFNITAITLSRAVLTSNVVVGYGPLGTANAVSANSLATLTTPGVSLLYSQSGKSFLQTTTPGSSSSATYNLQNGQPTASVVINYAAPTSAFTTSSKFGNVVISEYPVPSYTSLTDNIIIGIYNSTQGSAAYPSYQLNYTATGGKNNLTYQSSQFNSLGAPQGFVTERGSTVASLSPQSVVINYATTVNQLQFAIGPTGNSTALVKKGYAQYTYGLGQAVSLPGYTGNVTVGAITATVSATGANGQSIINGIANVTSNPVTVTSPVLLRNLTSTPLVVLDSGASPSDSLVLIGSGIVNSVSAQLQSRLNISNSDLDVTGGKVQASGNQILVAGYTAEETLAAASSFIAQLYANAATT